MGLAYSTTEAGGAFSSNTTAKERRPVVEETAGYAIDFDASRHSSIYSDSYSKVQQPAVQALIGIRYA